MPSFAFFRGLSILRLFALDLFLRKWHMIFHLYLDRQYWNLQLHYQLILCSLKSKRNSILYFWNQDELQVLKLHQYHQVPLLSKEPKIQSSCKLICLSQGMLYPNKVFLKALQIHNLIFYHHHLNISKMLILLCCMQPICIFLNLFRKVHTKDL